MSNTFDKLLATLTEGRNSKKHRLALVEFAKLVKGRRWLIWNHERGMWWKRNCHGYTPDLNMAGRFTFDEAHGLTNEGNRVCLGSQGKPQDSLMEDI